MAAYFHCCCCKQRKKKNPRLKSGQRYCGSRSCQQARKNKHEHERLKNDPGYYAKLRAQKANWQDKQLGSYHKTYRANHPDYSLGNLILQKTRYQRAKTCPVPGLEPKIVKTDPLTSEMLIESGLYEIRPYKTHPGKKIVKTDALIVALSIHSGFQEGPAGNPAFL
ncbi:MAG: hypothetical protein ACOC4R_01925 [Bacteroidota bacterium]